MGCCTLRDKTQKFWANCNKSVIPDVRGMDPLGAWKHDRWRGREDMGLGLRPRASSPGPLGARERFSRGTRQLGTLGMALSA